MPPPFFDHRRPPRWWPEGEAWPPRHAPDIRRWREMRGRFLSRVGCAFLVLLIFMLVGLGAAYWLVSTVLGLMRLSPDVVQTARWGMIVFVVIAVVVVATIGSNLRRLVLPFGDLLEAAGRVAEGDYAARVAVRGSRELRALAGAFNHMAGRLQEHDEQRRQLLADVTHELRTPLTVIQGNLEGILDGVYPADPAHLEPLLEEARTLSRVIDDLRTLTLAESGALQLQREAIDPAELLRETAASFQPRAASAGIELVIDAPVDLPTAELDPVRMREVLSNLVANALRYTPGGGRVWLRCWAEGTRLWFSVRDSGPGIPAADLPHVFERYYKSADSRGMGLGLAIARRLVEAHGGGISAESKEGQGTEIRFWVARFAPEQTDQRAD